MRAQSTSVEGLGIWGLGSEGFDFRDFVAGFLMEISEGTQAFASIPRYVACQYRYEPPSWVLRFIADRYRTRSGAHRDIIMQEAARS